MTDAEVWVEAAVEGALDEAVARALIETSGLRLSNVYGRRGKDHLLNRLPSFCQASSYSPWLVLIDLDTAAGCAPSFLDNLAVDMPDTLCLRIAVREIESWIMADRSAFASFIGVSQAKVPALPDNLGDPKQTLINLARLSRKRKIREGVVPTASGHRSEGPLYTTLLTEFVSLSWTPVQARTRSPSLSKCLTALERLNPKVGNY